MSRSSGSIRRPSRRCGPCRSAARRRRSRPSWTGEEIFTIGAPLRAAEGHDLRNRQPRGAACHRGRLQPRRRGSAGGPVFTAGGGVVGITSVVDDNEQSRRGDARVVRIDDACDVVASAEKKMKDARAAERNASARGAGCGRFPSTRSRTPRKRRAGSLSPYQMSSSDFDVAFITPVLDLRRAVSVGAAAAAHDAARTAHAGAPSRRSCGRSWTSATGPSTSRTFRRCCWSA